MTEPMRRRLLAAAVLGGLAAGAGVLPQALAQQKEQKEGGGMAGAKDAERMAEPALPSAEGSRIVTYQAFASKHAAPRRVDVWLPPGYDGSDSRYAVLYMHDGQNLTDPATSMGNQPWAVDRHLVALQRAGRIRPTILVGIWNTAERWREYAPAEAVRAMTPEQRGIVGATPEQGRAEPLADGYLRFLVEELKPFIDKTYRTRPGREDTVIMGSSMGGLISSYALARYPEVFGGAGCVSTHWPFTGNRALLEPPGDPRAPGIAHVYIDWLEKRLPAPGRHRIYFDHGTGFLDVLYTPYQQRVDAVMQAKGWRADRDWMSRVFPGADHNEPAWRARLALPLEFLLRP